MRVPNAILDCLCFLCVRDQAEAGGWKYFGTAFFVMMPSEIKGGPSFGYLSTARHCVEEARKKNLPLFIRVNTHDGDADHMEISYDAWEFPANPASDVAVLRTKLPDATKFHYAFIERKTFATSHVVREKGIGIGDDLVFPGCYPRRSGGQRNLPILRMGNIAAMADEPLFDDKSNAEYHAYLAEARSIGGLSGSPVFVYFSPLRLVDGQNEPRGKRYRLIGIIRGHWYYEDNAAFFSTGIREKINEGIAIVTPVDDLVQLLDGDKLMKERKKQSYEVLKRNAPTLDSALKDPPPFSQEDFEAALKKVTRKTK